MIQLSKIRRKLINKAFKKKNARIKELFDESNLHFAKFETEKSKHLRTKRRLAEYDKAFKVIVETRNEQHPRTIAITSIVDPRAFSEYIDQREAQDRSVEELLNLAGRIAKYGMFEVLKEVGKIR